MKLIFLDVDGVLNHAGTPEWVTETHNKVVDKECVANLKDIIAQTGALIVLTSTWRLSDHGITVLINEGLHFIGATPSLGWNYGERHKEILKWMGEVWPFAYGFGGNKMDRIAIIDDERDADLGEGSFFKTDFQNGGLTKEIAKRVIEHLNKRSQLI